jgi:hypothetical protein
MFKKIRLGSSIAALFLFALPWMDIQCSEKSMATQTGFQAIYGGGSASEEMKAMGDDSKKKGTSTSKSKSPDSMGYSPLIGLALISVVAAAWFSYLALFRGSDRAERYSAILPAIALGLVLLQLMMGFPAKKKIIEAMSEGASKSQTSKTTDDPFSGLGESMASAMMMNIRVKTTPAFYLELLALAIPTLLLANSLIDKHKKQEGEHVVGGNGG